jgi:transcription elongation factor Elf1
MILHRCELYKTKQKTTRLRITMKCYICNNDTLSIDKNAILCTTCKQLNRSDLFSKILTTLLDIYSTNKGFDAVKDKCIQLNTTIKNYPLFITPFSTFDLDEHDTDRNALHFLRNYVISEDNNSLQKHHPVKIDESNSSCLYKTIAILCRLDIEDGGRELRVRNVIDMVLNAEIYYSADSELHSCLQWGETWRYFVLELLNEKQSVSNYFFK